MRLYRISNKKRLYPMIWMQNSIFVFKGYYDKETITGGIKNNFYYL